MEIKVGEYVRTRNGIIFKTTEYWVEEYNKEPEAYTILKHSPNIIDLIEIGDILRILDNLGGCEHKVDIDDKIFLEETKNNFKDKTWKLLSILTHEQFSSLEYII